MSASVSVEFLLRVAQASPEEQAVIEAMLSNECRVSSGVGKEFTAEARTGKTEIGKLESRNGAGVGEMLAGIYREIASVRKDFSELRSAKERLEKMLADGVFAFTRKVDARSFQAFCTILGEGDVSKAARVLGMGDSTLRDVLRGWAYRGDAYQRMLDVVRWRKRVGRAEKVPLNENILLGKAESRDYPELLSDILDGLLSMTAGNWEDLSKELAEMLKGEMG